ncbi:hypothetical protein EEW87_17690 (plasmid) [Janibacter melonis]|uniref:Uncharacterized protein n=1 Tax=Janibacter melonis TaxID=262209 RepID=A0A650GEK3_9MICO|nr:hypothetical protein [Janibacter melonis]QGX08838.1 hypothetical protein EEW87_17690 [Janibacter melonis]
MLINALYLDGDALASYIASAEGGLRRSGSARSKGGHGFGGAAGFPGARLEARSDSEDESTLNVDDHDASRLQRLIAAGRAKPEEHEWREVLEPDTEFPSTGTGTLIDWECEVYVPESIAPVANQGEFKEALKTMETLMPQARALGLDMEGLPDAAEMSAVAGFLENVDVALVVVSEDMNGSDWKIVGSLNNQWIAPGASFDGYARIVAKVKRTIPAGSFYPLLSLPGMNVNSRAERRRQEREGPANDADKELFLEGPLLIVDYLAIYT